MALGSRLRLDNQVPSPFAPAALRLQIRKLWEQGHGKARRTSAPSLSSHPREGDEHGEQKRGTPKRPRALLPRRSGSQWQRGTQGGTELQRHHAEGRWHVPTQRGAQTLHGTSKGGLTAQLKLSPGVNRKIQHQRPQVYPRAETQPFPRLQL